MDASDLQHEKPEDVPVVDWQQVLLNGGPPCFFIEGPQYCGRAERWQGHGNKAFHDYVSLDDLLTTVRKEAREAAFKQMVGTVATLPTRGTINYRRGYEEGVRDALRTIEAANTEEGGGDAEVSQKAKSNRS